MRILWILVIAGCGGGPAIDPPGPATGLWARREPLVVPGVDDRTGCAGKSDGDYQWLVCPKGAVRRDLELQSVSWSYPAGPKLLDENIVLVDHGRAAWVASGTSWIYLGGAKPFLTSEIQGAPAFSGSMAYWLDGKLGSLDGSTGESRSWKLPGGLPGQLRIRYAAPTYIVLEQDRSGVGAFVWPTTGDLWLLEYPQSGSNTLVSSKQLSDVSPRSKLRPIEQDLEQELGPARIVRATPDEIYYLDRTGIIKIACESKPFENYLFRVEKRADRIYFTSQSEGTSNHRIWASHGDTCDHVKITADRVEANDDGSFWYSSKAGFGHVDRDLKDRGEHPISLASFRVAGPTTAWILTTKETLHRVEYAQSGTYIVSKPWSLPPELRRSQDQLDDDRELVEHPSGTTIWIASNSAVVRATLVDEALVWATVRVASQEDLRDLKGTDHRLIDQAVGVDVRGFDLVEELPDGALGFATGALRFRKPGLVLQDSELAAPPSITLPLSAQNREVNLAILAGDGKVLADHYFWTSSPSAITWKEPGLQTGTPLRVRLDIRPLAKEDPFQGLRAEWTAVTIRPASAPWYARPWSKGALLAIGLLVVILSLSVVAPKIPTIGQWLGIIVSVGGGIGAWRSFGADISIPAFAIVLGGSLLMLGGLGALHPAILETMGQLQPTRVIAQLASRSPAVRRRMYAEPAARVQRWLEGRGNSDDGAQLAGEYVSLPAAIERIGLAGGSDDDDAAPAAWIADNLGTPLRRRPHVVVLGPAGCGKTAMLRHVTATLLERHRASARNPLPVVLELQQDKVSIRDNLWTELERSLKSRDAFDWAVAAGDFIVVIDGISERGLDPADYQEFFRARDSAGLRMLASSRPSDEVLAAFRAESLCSIVRPSPLRDEHLAGFFEKAKLPDGLPEPVLRACRQADGTYLPLLVRLAILAHEAAGDHDIDIAGVYRRGIDRLLFGKRPEDDALRLAAMKLAHDSYWANGRRSFLLHEAFVPAAAIRDRLREGLLVSVGQSGHELRFAHDSLQVFLTAEQLVRDDNRAAFYEAATAPRFRAAGGAPALPEMFHFCCVAFDPAVVRQQLLGELRGWTTTHGDLLARAQLRAAMPDSLGAHVDAHATPEMNAGKILGLAADRLETESDSESLELFYARIARSVAEGERLWRSATPDPAVAARPDGAPR